MIKMWGGFYDRSIERWYLSSLELRISFTHMKGLQDHGLNILFEENCSSYLQYMLPASDRDIRLVH
ncbi:hypothetical protein PGB90_003932 [Kerria lacca]